MLEKLPLDEAIIKAKSLVKNGEIEEAHNLYKSVSQSFLNQARDIKETLSNLNNITQKNDIQNLSQETIDQLINLYSEGQFLVVVKQARTLTRQYPNEGDIFHILGASLTRMGVFDEAIEAFKKAVSLRPDFAESHKNLGLALLNIGEIKEGLKEYEWRWKTTKFIQHQRHFQKPLWDGQTSLNGKRILIWCEQGIGDTMNWSSCLSYITSQAEHVILECQEKLVPLLSRSFPNVDVKVEDRSFDAERDDFDLHLPMGSLYKHFIDEVLENKKSEAYLVADPDRVKFWKERLRSVGEGPYVGISWKSSVKSAYRLLHYPPISEWSPVLNVPDVTFINLQYTDYADDIAKVQDEFGVTIHNFDDIDQYGDIDDVAALCTALDMVVSTKVTPPMISAAVGTPTKIANWRQSNFTNILNNPNITSFEMFHKDTEQSWDNVFSLITKEISMTSRDKLEKK